MFTEDLTGFFDSSGFAIAATLQGGSTVKVIFDRASFDQLGAYATNPVALAIASQVSESNVGQTLTISGTAYTITKREPQDDGAIVRLQLQV